MKKFFLSSCALVLIAMTGWAIATTTAAPQKAAAEEQNLVDVTEEITNPQFNNGTTGWTVKTGKIEVKGTSSNPVVTAYNYKVDVYQTITGLQAGNYILKVQACSRHKDGKTGITEYQSQGSSTPNKAYIYANGEQKKIKYIYEEGYDYDFAKESGQSSSNLTLSNGLQIPYNSTNFSRAFGEFGMYENELEFTVASDGVATIGIKNELSGSSYKPYIAYDNFRLYRVDNGGSVTPTDPTDPTDPEEPTEPEEPGEMTGVVELYDLNAPAGTLVPVCMPYAVKSSYFGQVYTIGSIQNGTATIVPVDEVATGVPCVVKSSGASTIKKGDVTVNTSTRPKTFSLWDNTLMQANSSFSGYTWTATDIYNNTINASNLTFVEGDLSNLEFTASIENNAVARFWAQNPTYLAETPSTVGNYLSDQVYNSSSRRDKPNPVLVPVVVSSSQQTLSYWEDGSSDKQSVTVAASKNVAEIYELTPGVTYNYQCGQARGRFTVSGTIRMLNIGTNVANMRDLGGKKTADGRYVRYGKIYRSAEFKGSTYNINTEEKNKLVALGIGAEIDLRNTDGGTTKSWIPNVKEGDNYFYAKYSSIIANGPARLYETSTINMLKKEFAFLFEKLNSGVAVQFHCRIGADRTGLFAFLIQGILGVSESDILREYELTSFSSAGLRTKAQGDSNGGNYETELPKIKAKYPGSTFTQVFENYFKNTLGISQEQIDNFRNIMLVSSLSTEVEIDADQVAANQFKETYNDVLNLTVETVKSSDLENINAAIAAFGALSQKAQNYLTSEKAKLDVLKTAAEAKKAAEEEAAQVQAAVNTFKANNATILAKTTETVEVNDLTAINKALEDYGKLSEKAKAALTNEKALLDALKTAAENKQTEEEQAAQLQAEINKFKADNAAILAKSVETVESADLTAISKAIEDYGKLSDKAKAALTNEKALLDALKTAAENKQTEEEHAAQLQAEINTFKTDNAVVLAKTTETVEVNDLTAISKAIEDYGKLSEKAKAALTNEKALLDALKTAAENKQTEEEQAAQLQAEINKFKADNAAILAKTAETVEYADLDAINNALEDYNNLSDKAKAALTNEKALLDALLTAAENKQTEEEQAAQLQAEINKFKADNAAILAKTAETVEYADLDAINNALEDYKNLSDKAKAALTNEKALLDALKTAAEAKQPAEDNQAEINAKIEVVEGLIEEVDAKITKWRKYNIGTGWGQYTCNHPEYITAAEAEVAKAEQLIAGTPSIEELDAEIEALNASSAALDEIKMTLNWSPFFFIKSKNNNYLTLWPGSSSNSAMKKASGKNLEWVMYSEKTNYSIFTINDSGNIVQVLPNDASYPGYGFAVDGDDIIPINMNGKSNDDTAEFTPADDDETVNIKLGDLVISENGFAVSAVAEDSAGTSEEFVLEALTAENSVTGIKDIKAEMQAEGTYNIAGQRVSDEYKGIVIRDGKRLLVK